MSATPRAAHPYHMHDAMYAQPGARRLVTRGNDVDGAAARISKAARVVVCGIGSSLYAALVAEQLFAQVGRLGHRVRAVSAFDMTTYGPPLDADTTVLVISHSGSHQVVKRALAHATASGAATIAVTGKQGDGLAAASMVLRTVTPEASTTHTVSYTILGVLPLQQLAYHTALARGANPDTMRTHEPTYGRVRSALSL